MKKIGFKIIDSVTLETDRGLSDLHNDYSFKGFHYSVDENKFLLMWMRRRTESFGRVLPKQIVMTFNAVKFLAITPRDSEIPIKEDNTLDFIGYLRSEDVTEMNGYLDERMADDTYQIIVKFSGGQAIKIFADEVAIIEADEAN